MQLQRHFERLQPLLPSLPTLEDLIVGRTQIETALAADGGLSVRLGGRQLNSSRAPMREIERQLNAIEEFIEKSEQGKDLFLLAGAPAGQLLSALIERRHEKIIYYESHLPLLALTIEQHDLAPAVESGKLTILQQPLAANDQQLKQLFSAPYCEEVLPIPCRSILQLFPDYALFLQRCADYLDNKSVNLTTISRFDRLWSHNLRRNLSELLSGRPIQRLYNQSYDGPNNCAYGHTAIICGGGPSLTAALPKLAHLQKNALLYATDTALPLLDRFGIKPDFVITVDAQAINSSYLEGFALDNSLLVADPTTATATLRRSDKRGLVYFWSPFALAQRLFAAVDEPIGEITFGGSVATNCYDLALRLGARRILFLGQDLSFSGGGMAHARGSRLEERLNWREGRLFRRESHNYRQLAALPTRYLPRHPSGDVRTNDKLVLFLRWFERRIAQANRDGVEHFNFSIGGAVIDGTVTLARDEFMQLQFEDDALCNATNAIKIRSIIQNFRSEWSPNRESINRLHQVITAEIDHITQLLPLLELHHEEQIAAELKKCDLLNSSIQHELQRSYRLRGGSSNNAQLEEASGELYIALKRNALQWQRELKRTLYRLDSAAALIEQRQS